VAADPPPLPVLLSQVLVAFTIEFDNEAERRMTHRTTIGRQAGVPGRGPWLVSLPMWSNFLKFVSEDGVPLRELEGLAAIINLTGLQRWGYITVGPGPGDSRPAAPRSDWVVRSTRGGRHAQRVWRPLAAEIEARWQDRFGAAAVAALRETAQAMAGELGVELPWYLPVVGHAMFARAPALPRELSGAASATGDDDLSVLLSRLLLAFTLDYEQDARLSLTMTANTLRVVDDVGVRLRDLPGRAGVSREAAAVTLKYLEKDGCLVVEPDPEASRGQIARLTPKGSRAQEARLRRLAAVEEGWRERFGGRVGALRESLLGLLSGERDGRKLLGAGLQPGQDGWRADRQYLAQTTAMVHDPAAALPHHPMVLHRGGWPDGS
jgi:DNA-binding MarR family transcriptional regulator